MIRHRCESFGDFLQIVVRDSGCNVFTAKQFRHATDGQYLTREAYEQLQEEIRTWQMGRSGLEGVEVVAAGDEDEIYAISEAQHHDH